jgi:hypothetical protein
VHDTTVPQAAITSPQDGGSYEQGSALKAQFSCADNAGGSGVKTCAGDLDGQPVADGDTVDTSKGHKLTVTATDNAGNTATSSATYTVRNTNGQQGNTSGQQGNTSGQQRSASGQPVSPANPQPGPSSSPVTQAARPCSRLRGHAQAVCFVARRHRSALQACARVRNTAKRARCARAATLAYRRARAVIRCRSVLTGNRRSYCVRRARRLV